MFCRIWQLQIPRWVRVMRSRLVEWISAACLLHATPLDIFAIMSPRYYMIKGHIQGRTVYFKWPPLSGATTNFWVKRRPPKTWSILPTRMRIRLSSLGTPCFLVDVADSSKEQWVCIVINYHNFLYIYCWYIELSSNFSCESCQLDIEYNTPIRHVDWRQIWILLL